MQPPPQLIQTSSTIRHSGRCHIRGQFRRIWRPRYLELYDSGLIRYYELPITADVTLPELSDLDHVNMIPKDTLIIFHARIIDVTTLRDLHVGLPEGSFGFLFRGQRQVTNELLANPEPNPPREYFCAVSTLEEAQTWVVALQWAATVCQQQRQASSSSFATNKCSIEQISNISSNQRLQKQAWQLTMDAEEISKSQTSTTTMLKTENKFKGQNKSRTGRIVVTKIQGYRIIKSAKHMLQWEMTYEISILLLRRRKAEERRILFSAQDIQTLIFALELELQNNPKALQVLDRIRQTLLSLPILREKSKPRDLIASFPIVEQAFRSLAMQATIVNTNALKRAFALDIDKPTIQESRWWQTPKEGAIIFQKMRIIPRHVTSDEFVKDWLNQQPAQKRLQPSWLVHHGALIIVGGIGVALAVLYPVFLVYYQQMISISLRLDVLLLSWILAAWIGKRHSTESRHKFHEDRFKSLHTNRVKDAKQRIQVPIAPPVSIVDSRDDESAIDGDELDSLSYDGETRETLSSPLPQFPANSGESCWSIPPDNSIFRVRGKSYLEDRIKIPSGPSPFKCRGVDLWLTDNPQRHIARHPSVLGGKLADEDTFMVNFLLPFGNFVSYFTVPPISEFPGTLAGVWSKFVKGDQQYRDARLKLLPIVLDGPWIVKAAVGNGTAPALLGKVIPLQYFFREPDEKHKGMYEVDVIITASSIAKGILSVVKGHTKSLTIAFAFIIEAAEQEELPETVLCSFQIHALHLENCPELPECNLDAINRPPTP